jgi:hypothetical protein
MFGHAKRVNREFCLDCLVWSRMSTSVLTASLLGAGGSVVGGFVGGWMALTASRGQSKREARARVAERSSAAALSIAESLASLEIAVVSYAAGDIDTVALCIAFNVFAQTASVQMLAISDPISERVSEPTSIGFTHSLPWPAQSLSRK